jgi:hypothetical protein
VSEKLIDDDLSRVEESATKSTYELGVDFERCEDKGGKSPLKFIPNSNYHQEEKIIKFIKALYPSNHKPTFNLKRGVKKETPKPRGEAFVCVFYGRAGHLDEFCFWHKRIEKMRLNYARNSYHDDFIDFSSRSYSRVLPRSYSRASSRTSSRALSHFSHGPNHHSYSFDSQENNFVPRCSSYGPRLPRGDHTPRRHGFPTGESHTCFKPRYLDGPPFSRRDSHPTGSKAKVQKTVKTSSGHMVKCWIAKIYLTNPSTEPSTFSRHM